MEHLRCVVERITYQNEENGYSVLKVAVRNYRDLVTVVGTMPETHVGSVLSLDGAWKVDAKYGRQFSVERFEETLPATVYGIEKYLGSGLVKGVGPKFASRIVQKFGKDTLDVIEEEPDRLLEVEGIGKVRVERIKKSWVDQKEIKNIMLFLQGHQVSTAHATKIYKTYGSDSIKIVKDNPYRLADDIWGIGFKTADMIAEKLGIEKDRFVRLRSGILYTLNRLSESGHCYAEREQLVDTAVKLLTEQSVKKNAGNAVVPEQSEVVSQQTKAADARPNGFGQDESSDSVWNQPGVGGNDCGQSSSAGQETEDNDVRTKLEMTLDEMLRTQDVIREVETSRAQGSRDRTSPDIENCLKASPATEEAIYLPPFYFSETGCAKRLLALLAADRRVTPDVAKVMEQVQSRSQIQYDEIQLEAIRAAVSSKVMVLTGGPGTGKTTTTMGIISAYKMAGCQIILAAPTGRAAKRMSEAAAELAARQPEMFGGVLPRESRERGASITGMEAKTIHRLLEYKPPEGYQKNEEHPLEGDVLILDECSMIDIMLMYNLLKALPEHMTLIMVGDTDQLPSIGAGNVLKDIIASERIPVARLTRIFRQAQGSRIIMNAHRINKGENIDMRGGRDSDFFFAARETNEEVMDTLVKYCTKNLPQYYHVDAFQDIQVLTPMQRGVCGAANLNRVLQAAMNPCDIFLRRGGTQYRLRDKVMQIRNDYDKEVFNGDIGTISKVDMEERELTVNFDGREVVYDVSELDELVLAYATTIHKAQGSEYPIVVMPLTMSHFVMLQRNLLYTGVTRAKKILVLIGEKKAVYYAIRNETTAARNTKLAERLRDGTLPAAPKAADSVTDNSGAAGKPKVITYKGGTQISMVAEEPAAYGGDLFQRLAQSKFRSSFSLKANDRAYVGEKGMDTIRRHAAELIAKRLAPAEPKNDGKQTPMRGHPVFVAQHTTATCCRGCLEKWHHIPQKRELTEREQAYVVNVIMEWIRRQMKN